MGLQNLITRSESATPDFGAIISRQAAAQISAELDNGEAFADLKEQVEAELRADMTGALAGGQRYVPSWQITHAGASRAEKLSSAMEEVLISLDSMECCEALMAALTHSECPHVAKLRGLLIDRYVINNAGEIAELRAAK
jgi:hypothetical protein